jgi:hypothetical protein
MKGWTTPFLDALTRMPNVSAACRVAGVTREEAYEAAQQDAKFRKAWHVAIEAGIEHMEQIAHQRATGGISE